MSVQEKIWITWEDHRRSRELAGVLGAKMICIHSKLPDGLSHIMNTIKTIRTLLKEKPEYLFVQNPSIFLAFVAGWFKKILGYHLIVDRHTNFRIGKKNRTIKDYVFTIISDKSLKMADLTIVTNNFLKNFLEAKGGTGFVLADKIPEFIKKSTVPLKGKNNIVFICTFAPDEPFVEVIESATYLPESTHIYITGNYKKHLSKLPLIIPKNIIFTDFLPEEDYINLLFSADLIIDFTSADWCLVCGGYEAMAVGKPFITSDTIALKEFYTSGTIFTSHSPSEIAMAIEKGLKNKDSLLQTIKVLKKEKDNEWNRKFQSLLKKL